MKQLLVVLAFLLTIQPVLAQSKHSYGWAKSGVTKLTAGTNVTLSPTTGVGNVTVNASGGGGGSADHEALTDNASAKTSNFNAAIDNFYAIDISAGSVTGTLPTAVGSEGKTIEFFLIGTNASNQFIVNTTSAQTISQYASGALTTNTLYAVMSLRSHGGNWVLR